MGLVSFSVFSKWHCLGMSGQEESSIVKQNLVFLPACILPKAVGPDGEWMWGEGLLCGEEISVLIALIKITLTHPLDKVVLFMHYAT